ncbi:MAG: aconitase X [Candidatus Faecousia sp.]|uniref:aconitase X n=1 Tax=Faecousia sp. TaxID=2952921 RepID=UPI002A8BE4A5|nr:aconitase X [Candidatus Faecousia sp.]
MELTHEQQAILDGEQGEVMAKIMKTLVMYGETFGATKMVPITSDYGHIVTSFGIFLIQGVFDLMDQLVDAGVTAKQKFSADPRPVDKNVPANPIQNLFFKIMYGPQKRYEKQLEQIGLLRDDAFTCACYFPEVGNRPKKGDVLSWAESSAVNFANSVLGARCNRNSGIIEMFGSIVGYVPYFGLLTDEGRKASWIVEVKTSKKPEAQLLGSAVGMKVLEDVPYIRGLDRWLGTELNDDTCAYLKDFGAATASNGSVGLYHIENLTPEAVEQGAYLLKENVQTYVIDDAELERVRKSYPVIWKNPDAKPKLCFIGCPHLTFSQLNDWTDRLEQKLKSAGRKKVAIRTVFTTAPAVLEKFRKTERFERLRAMGVVLSYICPLMYMNNPQCATMPVITNSNKLRTYTTSRYYSDAEILDQIIGGAKR